MIQTHQDKGVKNREIPDVLSRLCGRYRLKSSKVTEEEAKKAVVEKHPVLAIFGLRARQWKRFGQFYEYHPTSVLKKEDLGISSPTQELEGHAVVLTSFGVDHLRFMNSWGTNWADNGFFRVQSHVFPVLEYYDIHWTESDLLPLERYTFKWRSKKVAADLMRRFQGLGKAKFRCPRCHRESPVTEFSGSTSKVCCPKCRRYLDTTDESANDLALAMYLLSLSSKSEDETKKPT